MEVVESVLSPLRMPKNNSFISIPCKYINLKNSRRYYKRNTNSRSCTRPSSISHFSTIQLNPHYLAYLCHTPHQNIHRCFSRLAASEEGTLSEVGKVVTYTPMKVFGVTGLRQTGCKFDLSSFREIGKTGREVVNKVWEQGRMYSSDSYIIQWQAPLGQGLDGVKTKLCCRWAGQLTSL